MRPLDLPAARVGDRVQHAFLVLDRDERRQSNGDPYVILTFGNASGRIASAPVWHSQMEWIAGAEKGRVVQVIGEVAAFQRRRQLRITGPLRLLPADSVQPAAFLPRITIAPEQLWEWIDRARADMRSTCLRRVVDLFYADDAFRVELEQMPASIDGHHAVLGGLLLHVTEVATIARNSARVLKANTDLVLAGALLREIGGVQAFELTPVGFRHSTAGRLLGPTLLGVLLLHERMAAVPEGLLSASQRLELLHLVSGCNPGAGTATFPVEERTGMTLESEILRGAADVSAHANELATSLADDELSGDAEFHERLTRRSGAQVWRRPHVWE